MATYAQLQTETWWAREIVTPELDWLGDEMCRRTGRPRVAAGSKGDEHHLRGAHRSQEWIKNSRYCTNRTYTVQSGLTATQQRHIAGFDFSPGNTALMKQQTQRLIDAMRAGQLNEVLEFYGTTDGRTVTGWNNPENRYATSDSSHLWHWHISIDRRRCADRALMERIVAIALGVEEEDVALTDQQDKMLRAIDARVRALAALTPTVTTTWAADSDEVEQVVGAQALTEVRTLARAAAGEDVESLIQEIREQGEQTRAALETAAAAEQARDAELRELVRQAQSGELAADQVVRLMGERLSAPAGG